jgi:hypothetical protein
MIARHNHDAYASWIAFLLTIAMGLVPQIFLKD